MPVTESPARRCRLPTRKKTVPVRVSVRPEATLPTEEVWAGFRAEPTIAVRNAIVEAYLPLLRRIALRLHKRLPRQVELEDLESAGAQGLMDAIESYDPGQKTRFSTFCSKRVFGAIIDHLRDLDPTPRLVREREALLVRTRDEFRKQFGRMPAEAELLEQLGMGDSDGMRILKDGAVVRTTSLGQRVAPGESDRGPNIIEFVGEHGNAADAPVIRRDIKRLIVRHFDRSERLAIILYYYEQLTMREIGRVLGCSESRVSQIIDGILKRLRVYLSGREDELV